MRYALARFALPLGLLALALRLGTGCAARQAEPTAVAPPVQAALGIGDVFDVRVFGEADLSGVYRVASDGTINFPLVGKMKADGVTASELGSELERALGKFLRQPNVSVFVKEYNSKKVFVFGEVNRPGTFPYEEGMNIVQAVTLAGGFTKLADKDGTAVTRVVDEHEQRVKVPVKEIGEGKAPNFRLEPGDIVFVPESMF